MSWIHQWHALQGSPIPLHSHLHVRLPLSPGFVGHPDDPLGSGSPSVSVFLTVGSWTLTFLPSPSASLWPPGCLLLLLLVFLNSSWPLAPLKAFLSPVSSVSGWRVSLRFSVWRRVRAPVSDSSWWRSAGFCWRMTLQLVVTDALVVCSCSDLVRVK